MLPSSKSLYGNNMSDIGYCSDTLDVSYFSSYNYAPGVHCPPNAM